MVMSPDEAPRIIAANVRRLRRERGWKQEEAADALHAAGGPSWSKATWSALETSANGDRVRAFSATEVAYLAVTFDVPVGDLYAPPPPEPVPCPHCDGTGWIDPEPESEPYYGSPQPKGNKS